MNRFAFIIHPLEAADVARKFPALQWLPGAAIEAITRFLPPVTASKIEGLKNGPKNLEGYLIACPLTTRQMLHYPQDWVLKRIEKACWKAVDLGAQIIGLGAMTSVVGDAGVTLAHRLPVPVTTGNTYTIAAAIDGVAEALHLLERDIRESHVVVVGATGSVGSACARLLARDAKAMTLVSRTPSKLNRLASRILYETGLAVSVTTQVTKALSEADVVVTVSSAIESIVEPGCLKPGAVVCDVARPRDVSKVVAEQRKDVLVIEGGVIGIPANVQFGFNFGLPAGMAFACMAETMLLALEGRQECFSLGRDIAVEKVDEIRSMARKHGFTLAGLRSFERPLDMEQVQQIKQMRNSGNFKQVCQPIALGHTSVTQGLGQEAY